MRKNKFYLFGKVIYTYRFALVVLCAIFLGLCIPLVPHAISQFSATGFVDPSSQSAQATKYLDENLHYQHNRFLILYQSKKSFTANPAFFTEIRKSLSPLDDFYIRHQIIFPDDNKKQISNDNHTAYAVVLLQGKKDLSEDSLNEFRDLIQKPPHLEIVVGGQQILMSDTKKQTQSDLIRAEYIASPVAVITLLLVFGSVAAALIPMLLDGVCGVFIIGLLYLFGKILTLSIFTFNIALLLGLCLSLDYALFIINRFREELKETDDVKEALAVTMSTAGQAIFFSGLAVLISLSALLLFPINILMSVGVGGMIAVSVAVIVSLIILPALLAIIEKHIDWLSLPFLRTKNPGQSIFWAWLVDKVVKRPWFYFLAILIVLLGLGSPLLSIKLGISDYRIMPKSLPSRQVFDLFEKKFSENNLSPIYIVATAKDGDILSQKSLNSLYRLGQKLKHEDGRIEQIDSIVTTDPQLNDKQYHQLYGQPKSSLSQQIKQLLNLTTHNRLTTITVISKYPAHSKETKQLIKDIRGMKISGLNLLVTGTSATSYDVITKISSVLPYAFLWVMILTYLILLILLRSLFLPVKAIVVNMLSLFASYGILVFIIQEGHFASLLSFDPQGFIDVSLLIIIFCALFGFSMDYEVFLLSRIKERYEQTRDNVSSIRYGIVHSSKIITSAAIVVILICFSFLSASTLMVKAFGLGIALAIFIDAFLIRSVLVPALMTFLGKWNWYLPQWLNKVLPHLSFNPKENLVEKKPKRKVKIEKIN